MTEITEDLLGTLFGASCPGVGGYEVALPEHRILRVYYHPRVGWKVRVRWHEPENKTIRLDGRGSVGEKVATVADLFRVFWGLGLEAGKDDFRDELTQLITRSPPDDG